MRSATRIAALLLLLLGPAPCRAQSLFGPPEMPLDGSPGATPPGSHVRGVVDPDAVGRAPYQQAGIDNAPPATFQSLGGDAPLVPTIDTTAAIDANAKPIEGSEIIARIDGQIVLASDLLWQVKQILVMASEKQVKAGKGAIPPEYIERAKVEFTHQLLMGLIDTKLLYADFKRTVPAENMPKVEESLAKPFEEIEIPRLMTMFHLTDRAALERALAESGTSLKDVKRQFIEKTIASEWLRSRMPKSTPITYEALLAFYQDHYKEYEYPAQVKFEELVVLNSRCNGDRNEAWRLLCEMGNDAYQAAIANPELRGPAFANVAKAKSHGTTAADGGIQDWMTMGAFVNEDLNRALADLQIGQMSDGIATADGFCIIRVLDRKPAGRTPFTEAQARIREILENEQRQAAMDVEFKNLRSTARVWTVFDGELNGPHLAEVLEAQSKRQR